jgi:peptidylprolyl isomerase
VATSRRRERELARRRFERRRQAEIERRAKAKRRNTIIGASAGTAAVIAGIVVLVVALSGGSDKAKVNASKKPTASPSASAAPKAPKKCAKINPNPPAKGEPTVPEVKGKPSTSLVTKDIEVGTGKAAKAGDHVTVKYVGISCSTGEVFDASYTDGAPKQEFDFDLGAGAVIQGWDQGVVGMKPGGVRELVIPASLGYGAAGSGPKIAPNETLIFVVTLVKA